MYKYDYIYNKSDYKETLMKETVYHYNEDHAGKSVWSSWKRKNISTKTKKNSLLMLSSIGEVTCFQENVHMLSKRNENWGFYLVVEGKGSFRIHGKTIYFSQGDIFIIAPQFINMTFNISSQFLVLQSLQIVNSIGVHHMCIHDISEIELYHPSSFEKLVSLYDNIVLKMEKQQHDSITECVILQDVFAFLYEVEHQCFSTEHADPIRAIYDEINSFPGQLYSIQELAQKSGLGIRTLQRRFKEQIGCSIQNLITICRVGSARLLLQNTFLSISEIAFRCGYRDAALFSKVFKLETGMPPNEFRKKNNQMKTFTNTSNLASGLKSTKHGGIKELSSRQKQLLWLINEQRNISINDLSKKLKINPSAVQKHIESLKKEKILQHSGPKRGGLWIISRPDAVPIADNAFSEKR